MASQRSYRRGDTGPVVAEIRAKLASLGLLAPNQLSRHDEPDLAVFDDECDRAVRHFQQQRAITADGLVGPHTYRLLDEARWRLGDRVLSYTPDQVTTGDDVAQLQRRLLDMGFACGQVDGIFGPQTEHGLRDFQRNIALVPDGRCGTATLTALDRLTRTVVGGAPHAMRESEAIHNSGPSLADKLIVIDPGHGGADRGWLRGPLAEADVVWDLAGRVETRLSTMGTRVVLTRSEDAAPLEASRAERANELGADLLISLHVDGHASPLASGVATYFYGNDRSGHDSAVGQRFAGLVQREIVARTGLRDCRTHAKTWDLLRRTRMPAVRIELGYLTHDGDAAQLASDAFRDNATEAVVVAVQRLYLRPEDDVATGVMRLPLFV